MTSYPTSPALPCSRSLSSTKGAISGTSNTYSGAPTTLPAGNEVTFYDGLGVRKGIEKTPEVRVPGPTNMLSLLQQK